MLRAVLWKATFVTLCRKIQWGRNETQTPVKGKAEVVRQRAPIRAGKVELCYGAGRCPQDLSNRSSKAVLTSMVAASYKWLLNLN